MDRQREPARRMPWNRSALFWNIPVTCIPERRVSAFEISNLYP
ncbi:hypothetical protein PIIN_11280 [Serendipita indica DSM 11827]|uniref:Uncharacterized protein n=1 Tax=Serendipita indica (strain DSM 11827) TaxID=1109443 RepID=G4U160_SERID|nr:hypothetical protein PIIN_11280 [Serendipita indica DSM 11827]